MVSDNADADDGGDFGVQGKRVIGDEHRKVQRSQGRNRAKRAQPSGIITISVDLASGRYTGEARIKSLNPLIVIFPLGQNKNHECWITQSDVVDWKDSPKPEKDP